MTLNVTKLGITIQRHYLEYYSAECHSAECCYRHCCYADCRGALRQLKIRTKCTVLKKFTQKVILYNHLLVIYVYIGLCLYEKRLCLE
jgi:hypothetical protein